METKPPCLVIAREELFPCVTPTGFLPFTAKSALRYLSLIPHEFMERSDAEAHSDFKQIIPQICLFSNGKVFVHQIPKTAGEERLHDLWTIFLGGHIEGHDVSAARDTLMDVAMLREFREEIYYSHAFEIHALGLVNLEDTPVNRVHLGVVYVLHGEKPSSEPTTDGGVSEGRWMTFAELREKFTSPNPAVLRTDTLNGWSLACFDALELFCSELRPIADLRSDAERLALYNTAPRITSEHWPFRYTHMQQRLRAIEFREKQVPLVVRTERCINSRSFRCHLGFPQSDGFFEAETLTIPWSATRSPWDTNEHIMSTIKKFCDGYPCSSFISF